MNFIFKLFKFISILQNKIEKIHELQLSFFNEKEHRERKNIFCLTIFILPVLTFFIYYKSNQKFFLYAFLVFLFMFSFYSFFLDIKKPLVSVKAFCANNIRVIALTSLFIGIMIAKKIDNDLILLIVIYIIFFLLWLFSSLIANAKVSALVNTMITTTLTIISIIVNFASDIINLIITDSRSTFNPEQIEIINQNAHYIISSIKIALVPLLLISTFTTFACAVKKYWIDKYNDGIDIK